MENDARVTIFFAAVAAVIGSACGILDLKPSFSLILGALFFYVSYRMAPKVLDLEGTSFDTGAWNMLKTGGIPYWFLWLVFWTLVFTIRF